MLSSLSPDLSWQYSPHNSSGRKFCLSLAGAPHFRNSVLSCPLNFTEVGEFFPFPLLMFTFRSSTKVFRFLKGSSQISATFSSEKVNFDNILSTSDVLCLS